MPPTPLTDQRDKNAAFPLIVEQFVCPSDFCGANIPQSHIVSSYPQRRPGAAAGRQGPLPELLAAPSRPPSP